jgi:hypothetical protein
MAESVIDGRHGIPGIEGLSALMVRDAAGDPSRCPVAVRHGEKKECDGGRIGPGAVAVRGHDRVPLPVRTAHHRLSALVAILQTVWVRTGDERYLRATKFWGKLFLINFAMGVVTGIVQEFQFGLNWSAYSRFVGDIFGRRWPSGACWRSSWSRRSSACGSSVGTGCRVASTSPVPGSPRSAPS